MTNIWEKIDEIFPLVADLPPAARDRRLGELCGDDENLRREIAAMLAADDKAENFIETPVMLPVSLAHALSAAQTSDNSRTLDWKERRIGAYRIVRPLGTGGMGTVFLAERADGEFRKKVAVKLIKNGAATEFNLRRFRHERQILAALEHPNIARLIDGGTTSAGAPYFVMEHVEGEPLFDYCRARNLNLQARLRIFRQICAALEYAHRSGVIHRDIKPGNILVTDAGEPKLLDFGIAKILDADLIDDRIVHTETLLRQMTPEYASPEQICGDSVTPASDVYSLGVCLYELLTGERPYKFTSRAPHEIARVVCEQTVPSPKLDADTPRVDDLKFIVLKALEKKASERYASIAELDRDVERFLEGFPVLSESEQLKFLEKSAAESDVPTVSLAVTPFQVLQTGELETGDTRGAGDDFFGIGLADALTTRLSGVRRLAVRPTSSVLRLATELEDAQEIGRQLNADFVLTGHILRTGENIRVSVQLLRTADNTILWAQPFDESELDVFQLQDSISERVAVSLVPQITTEEHEILLRHGTSSAAAYEAYLRGRVSYHNYTFEGVAGAEKYFKEAIAHDANFALAHSGLADFYALQTIVGLVSNHEGFRRAKDAARRAIELDPELAEAYTALAFATWAYDWNFAEAEELFQKAIRLNPNYPRAFEWYAFLLSCAERHAEAIEKMRCAERLDLNSAATATVFALVLYNARRYQESLEKTRRAIELDPNYYIAIQSLGWILPRLGKASEGVEECRRAVRINDQQALNKFSLALALVDDGQPQEARAIASEIDERRQTAEIPAYFSALIYAVLGDDDKAFEWFARAVEERGYWTLRIRVEPRLDRLRSDARFAETLEKITNLQNAPPTKRFDQQRATETLALGEKFKNRKTFSTAAAVIGVAIVAALTTLIFNSAFSAKDDAPQKIVYVKSPAAAAEIPAAPNGRAANEKPRTSDPTADEFYLAGRRQLQARTPEGINKAIEFFTAAVGRDPNFTLAFSGLADAHILRASGRVPPLPEDFRKAEEYAVKALALDPDLAEARVSLAMAKFRNSRDFAAAEKHFLRAIELNPSLAPAHHWYSIVLLESGKFEDALREIKVAAELEPGSAVIQLTVGELCMLLKRYVEAEFYFDKAIANDAGFAAGYQWKSMVQQYRGEYDAALETYRKARIYRGGDGNEAGWLLMQAQAFAAQKQPDKALEILKNFSPGAKYSRAAKISTIEIALVYNLLGDSKNAFAWLEKCKIVSPADKEFLSNDPRFANLHNDTRFVRLTEKWRSS